MTCMFNAILICTTISIANLLKKAGVNLELLTDIDMLLLVEEGIGGGICQVIHRYDRTNNKYLNNYDKSIESYLMYLDPNNLYGWT